MDDQLKDKIQKRYNQLKGLQSSDKQSKISEEELWEKAKKGVLEKESLDEINIESLFPYKAEQKKGRDLLGKYLNDYTIESVSDKNTLCQLIYLEILNLRLQKALNDAQRETGAIPTNYVELIHKNINEITKLKLNLGISKKNKNEDKRDGFAYLQLVKLKYKKWLQENQASRTLWCPHCGKSTLLRMKMDVWETQKHPFFRDRILGNVHLIDLFKAKKLNRYDLAKVFEVSPDYIDWLVSKGWGLKIEDDAPPRPEDESGIDASSQEEEYNDSSGEE